MEKMSENAPRLPKNLPTRTKIVATLGPASESEEMIRKLVETGVDLFRINMAHGSPEKAQPLVDRIRKVSADLNQPIGILVDLAGPKMRLGELPGGEYLCEIGKRVQFIRGGTSTEPGIFTTTYPALIDDLKIGDHVLLADGTVTLEVTEKSDDVAVCRVVQGGIVRSRQGVNLPNVQLSIETIQPADRTNAIWAVHAGIDYLGLSFVRSPEDVRELRALLEKTAEEVIGPDRWKTLSDREKRIHYPDIIAKIEKPEILDHLDEVVEASDGVMVARGDLGVEANIARIAVIQKEIIRTCRRLNRPVIVATQMLESMTGETLPTRAEATDVANAILDGADACMLSGESAIGKYPVETVAMMNRIARETESVLRVREGESFLDLYWEDRMGRESLPESVKISITVCDAAGDLADAIDAAMIAVTTRTGQTARNLSGRRHFVMTVGTSENESTLRRMTLFWGVIPVRGLSTQPVEMLRELVQVGKNAGYLGQGDAIVLTAGIGTTSDIRNAIYVHQVE